MWGLKFERVPSVRSVPKIHSSNCSDFIQHVTVILVTTNQPVGGGELINVCVSEVHQCINAFHFV